MIEIKRGLPIMEPSFFDCLKKIKKINFYAFFFFLLFFSRISSAISESTRILPQYSQTIIFFLERISNCLCGGILLKHPPQAPRSTLTTARPFLAFSLIRVYALTSLSSISFFISSDRLFSLSSSFFVSEIIILTIFFPGSG